MSYYVNKTSPEIDAIKIRYVHDFPATTGVFELHKMYSGKNRKRVTSILKFADVYFVVRKIFGDY